MRREAGWPNTYAGGGTSGQAEGGRIVAYRSVPCSVDYPIYFEFYHILRTRLNGTVRHEKKVIVWRREVSMSLVSVRRYGKNPTPNETVRYIGLCRTNPCVVEARPVGLCRVICKCKLFAHSRAFKWYGLFQESTLINVEHFVPTLSTTRAPYTQVFQ